AHRVEVAAPVGVLHPGTLAPHDHRVAVVELQGEHVGPVAGHRLHAASMSPPRGPALIVAGPSIRRLPFASPSSEGGIVGAIDEILENWQGDGVEWVRFELPDMHGTSRSKTIPLRHASDYAQRGLNMYGGTSVLDTRSDVVGG